MSASSDLKASWIMEQLRAQIPGARLEYVHGGGMHRFVIAHGAHSYDVGFPEWLLEACSVEEVNRTVRLLVERVQTGAGPRRIRIGTKIRDRRAAA